MRPRPAISRSCRRRLRCRTSSGHRSGAISARPTNASPINATASKPSISGSVSDAGGSPPPARASEAGPRLPSLRMIRERGARGLVPPDRSLVAGDGRPPSATGELLVKGRSTAALGPTLPPVALDVREALPCALRGLVVATPVVVVPLTAAAATVVCAVVVAAAVAGAVPRVGVGGVVACAGARRPVVVGSGLVVVVVGGAVVVVGIVTAGVVTSGTVTIGVVTPGTVTAGTVGIGLSGFANAMPAVEQPKAKVAPRARRGSRRSRRVIASTGMRRRYPRHTGPQPLLACLESSGHTRFATECLQR